MDDLNMMKSYLMSAVLTQEAMTELNQDEAAAHKHALVELKSALFFLEQIIHKNESLKGI
jgi:hypothetical protein